MELRGRKAGSRLKEVDWWTSSGMQEAGAGCSVDFVRLPVSLLLSSAVVGVSLLFPCWYYWLVVGGPCDAGLFSSSPRFRLVGLRLGCLLVFVAWVRFLLVSFLHTLNIRTTKSQDRVIVSRFS